MWSTVLVEPPIATSSAMALVNADLVATDLSVALVYAEISGQYLADVARRHHDRVVNVGIRDLGSLNLRRRLGLLRTVSLQSQDCHDHWDCRLSLSFHTISLLVWICKRSLIAWLSGNMFLTIGGRRQDCLAPSVAN